MIEDLLSALGYVGSSLGKGGRAVRGVLGGRPNELLNVIPFAERMGLTNPEDEVTGSELLRQLGVADSPLLGMGVDILTDPLTYVGPATALKGLSWLRNAGRAAPLAAAAELAPEAAAAARPASLGMFDLVTGEGMSADAAAAAASDAAAYRQSLLRPPVPASVPAPELPPAELMEAIPQAAARRVGTPAEFLDSTQVLNDAITEGQPLSTIRKLAEDAYLRGESFGRLRPFMAAPVTNEFGLANDAGRELGQMFGAETKTLRDLQDHLQRTGNARQLMGFREGGEAVEAAADLAARNPRGGYIPIDMIDQSHDLRAVLQARSPREGYQFVMNNMAGSNVGQQLAEAMGQVRPIPAAQNRLGLSELLQELIYGRLLPRTQEHGLIPLPRTPV